MADKRPGTAFTVRTNAEKETGTIWFGGDVSVTAEEQTMKAYRTLTDGGAKKLVLDFAHAAAINSAGIAVLITLVAEARRARQKVSITGLTPHYRKIFEMIGLGEYVDLQGAGSREQGRA